MATSRTRHSYNVGIGPGGLVTHTASVEAPTHILIDPRQKHQQDRCRGVVGEWNAASVPRRVASMASVFQRSQGVVLMQLNTTASGHRDVHHVKVHSM